ncbi:MAG TPA: DNRLRE domain-containing protein [Patescibacteria group bacterium]|nr:DNRLRE domain-containing protein [Patescibacteria group bacterium]
MSSKTKLCVLTVSAFSFLAVPSLAMATSVGPVYPTAATYVSSAHPSTNYGTSSRLWVQNDTEQNYSILKFDLTQVIKPGTSATPCTNGGSDGELVMKVDEVSNGGHQVYLGETSTWTESGVTCNNMPAVRNYDYPSNDGSPVLLSDNPTASTSEDSVNDWTHIALSGDFTSACTYNSGILTMIVKDGGANAIAWKSNDASSEKPYAYFDVGN